MKNFKNATYNKLRKHDFSLEVLIHSSNVANITMKIADKMNLSEDEKKQLYEAALYHDIGKSKTPESILYKKGSLSPEEWDIMKQHAVDSEQLYLNIGSLDDETVEIAKVIRHHHENWDGTGYPDQLKGEEIPLHSRIIKIADMFEAMIQPRVYRPYKIQNVLEIMKELQGKEIDSDIFQRSYDVLDELLTASQRNNRRDWEVKIGGLG